jgi:mannose-1-phosphate guanylyltransferase
VSHPGTAFVLAAGLGTRLRPLTSSVAKPALPVAGRSLVERSLDWLAAAGVAEFIVNLHYRPETIAGILGDGTGHGVRVRYSWEQPLLGSAGGPRRAFALTGEERLWLVNADTLTDVDLEAMARCHSGSGALVTMAVIPNPDPARYGGVLVSQGGTITGFTHRGAPGPSWHFVGVQLAERGAFAALVDGRPADSVGAHYPSLIARHPGSVSAFRSRATFHDIGTPADYLTACLSLSKGDADRLVGAGSRVAEGAVVVRSVLWDDVEIGPGARVSDCVVMGGARVPPGFEVARQVVAPDLSLTPISG